MSRFLHHSSCEKCGSSDAKGVFDDGHEYCWSCRYYKPAELLSLESVNITLSKSQDKSLVGSLTLPLDISEKIPNEPFLWLKKYGITSDEIKSNRLAWSEERQMLVFPYYNKEDALQMWQGRYFPARTPKVFTRGNIAKSMITLEKIQSDTVVIVEDPVSAIKVNRYKNTCPLFGSNLSIHKAIYLSRAFDNLIIWLDRDKLFASVKMLETYGNLFKSCSIISTELDPKECSDEEIKKELTK